MGFYFVIKKRRCCYRDFFWSKVSNVSPGENKVSVSSALSFIKLLFQYKQSEAFSRLTKEMLQVLSVSHCWSSALDHRCEVFPDWVLCHRVRLCPVRHSGRPSQSWLCWTASTVCCAVRGAALETITWVMVATVKLCRTIHPITGTSAGHFCVAMNDCALLLTGRRKPVFREEVTGLVKTLHSCVCLLSPVSVMHGR